MMAAGSVGIRVPSSGGLATRKPMSWEKHWQLVELTTGFYTVQPESGWWIFKKSAPEGTQMDSVFSDNPSAPKQVLTEQLMSQVRG